MWGFCLQPFFLFSGDLYDAFVNVALDYGLKIANMAGFSGDSATPNFAPYNSFYAYMLQIQPGLLKGRCFAHILHHSFEAGLKKLSFDVHELVLKSHSHFAKSAKRRQVFINTDGFESDQYYEMKRHVKTRFLSLADAFARLNLNWDRLIKYLETSTDLKKGDKLKDLLFQNGDINMKAKVYSEFIEFIGNCLNQVSKSLQSKDHVLMDLQFDLNLLIRKLNSYKDLEQFGSKTKIVLNSLNECDQELMKTEFKATFTAIVSYIQAKLSEEDLSEQLKFMSYFCLKNLQCPIYENISLACEKYDLIKLLNINEDQLIDEFIEMDDLWTILIAHKEFTENKSSIVRWSFLSSKINIPNIMKLISYFGSVPSSSCYTEGIFSLIKSKWSDERCKASIDLIDSEVKLTANICVKPKDYSQTLTEETLKDVMSADKY